MVDNINSPRRPTRLYYRFQGHEELCKSKRLLAICLMVNSNAAKFVFDPVSFS